MDNWANASEVIILLLLIGWFRWLKHKERIRGIEDE